MIRLIARIDSRNRNHIKTIQCEGTKIIRPVLDSLRRFSQGKLEHDEIIILDNVASLYGVNNWMFTYECDHMFVPIPLSIGGGINTMEKAFSTLAKGSDKIVLNTAAINDPTIISSVVNVCGSQAVVIQIDSRAIDGEYRCFTHGGRELSEYSVAQWISIASDLGAGEIFATSIDTEGCSTPFPYALAEILSLNHSLPVIVSGGIRTTEQIKHLHSEYGLSAFAFSSLTNILNQDLLLFREELINLGLPVRTPT